MVHQLERLAVVSAVILAAVISPGCIKAPLELKTAMSRQAEEISTIHRAYEANITNLLAALEKSQMDYLQQAEDNLRTKYLFEGKIGEAAGPNSDPDLVAIRLKTEKRILELFTTKRALVRANFEKKRFEFLKLQANIDNVAKINSAMSDYVDSLIRLRRAQDSLGQALLNHLGSLDKSVPIISGLVDEVIHVTGDELDKFLPEKASKAAPPGDNK